MTIEQTIEVPANRLVTFEVPPEIPVGKAKVLVTTLEGPQEKTIPSLASLRGIHKGLDTIEAHLDRKRRDKAKEDAQFERMRKQS